MKRITDKMAVQAQWEWREKMFANKRRKYARQTLRDMTGRSLADCEKALERAVVRGYLDYGVSLRTAWLTDAGRKLIGKEET